MIYVNSKGEKKELKEMNIHELKATAQKADRVLNWMRGNESRLDPEGFEPAVRYIQIVRDEIWAEVEARNITGIDEHLDEVFSHLSEGDRITMKNFIKTNFTLKERS